MNFILSVHSHLYSFQVIAFLNARLNFVIDIYIYTIGLNAKNKTVNAAKMSHKMLRKNRFCKHERSTQKST